MICHVLHSATLQPLIYHILWVPALYALRTPSASGEGMDQEFRAALKKCHFAGLQRPPTVVMVMEMVTVIVMTMRVTKTMVMYDGSADGDGALDGDSDEDDQLGQ